MRGLFTSSLSMLSTLVLLSVSATSSACLAPVDEDVASELDDGEQTVEVQTTALAETSDTASRSENAPLQAPDRVWTYIEFPGTTCRDGSPAGIAISKSASSKKLMIYLEGGGVCFDAQTCDQNPANTEWQRYEQTGGVFDRSNPQNPVRDWNFVYVAYCSGDLHGGARRDVTIPERGVQQFVGALNLRRFLKRLAPTFSKVTDVVLTGVSAGGLGATMNMVPVQEAFPKVRVRLVDDSGPFLGKAALATCLQNKWRTTFGYDRTFLADCGAACRVKNDYFLDYALFLAKKYNDRPSGLIESVQDEVIADYYGIGANDCTGELGVTTLPPAVFRKAVLDFRAAVKSYSRFGTYLPDSSQHTWLGDNSFYEGSVGDSKLVDWFAKIATGKSAGHVGP